MAQSNVAGFYAIRAVIVKSISRNIVQRCSLVWLTYDPKLIPRTKRMYAMRRITATRNRMMTHCAQRSAHGISLAVPLKEARIPEFAAVDD